MSAAKADDSKSGSKKTHINKKEVEALTNILFLRKISDKVSPFQKSKKPEKGQSSSKFCEAHMIGTIEEGTPTGRVAWRLMGMRMKRADGVSTDYDVHRMPSEKKIDGVTIEERLPMDKREGILRVCRFESDEDLTVFQHEYNMFKMLATSYPRGTERIHYLSIIGEGRLSELRYLNLSESSKLRDHVEVPSVPRPYFILESVEPSLETLFKSNRNKSLPLHVSVFAAIGCVKALRLLHMKGYAHRNVQPAYFSIRLPCGSLLCRKESELCDMIAITELWCCRKYRVTFARTKTSVTYLGNWKYGSIETLSGKVPTAIDDLISCMYMLTEFALGELPWQNLTEKQAIIYKKRSLEEAPRLEDEKKALLLNNYSGIYTWLRKQAPLQTIDYEAFYEEILKMPDTGAQPSSQEQSLFGFSNPLADAYDHGFIEKKMSKDKDKKSKMPETSGKKKRKLEKSSSRGSAERKTSAEGSRTRRTLDRVSSRVDTLKGKTTSRDKLTSKADTVKGKSASRHDQMKSKHGKTTSK